MNAAALPLVSPLVTLVAVCSGCIHLLGRVGTPGVSLCGEWSQNLSPRVVTHDPDLCHMAIVSSRTVGTFLDMVARLPKGIIQDG